MQIVCKIAECRYCSSNGFCTNDLVFITQRGQCGRVFDVNGNIKPGWNDTIKEQKKEERIKEIIDEEDD